MSEANDVKIGKLEENLKIAHKRLDTQEKDIDKLKNTYSIMEKMDYRMGKVETSVEQIDKRLEQQAEKKGLKWDKLIDYLFYAVLAYALFKLGLK